MKLPKTVRGYLKMLLNIAGDSVEHLNHTTEEEWLFLVHIRGDIQNALGEDEHGVMEKHGLKWEG